MTRTLIGKLMHIQSCLILILTMAGIDLDRLFLDLASDDSEIALKASAVLVKRAKSDPKLEKRLIQNLRDGPEGQRYMTASILGRAGSKSAIPVLASVWFDEKEEEPLRSMCASALALIGHESADVFRKALKKDSTFLRRKAADGLGRMAIDDPSVVPDLVAALGNSDPDVRTIAQGGLCAAIEHSRPFLKKAVDEKNPLISVLSARALLDVGSKDQSLVAKQLSYLNHHSSDVRYYATGSLWDVKENRKELVPAVTKRLEDEDRRIRGIALMVLAAYGVDARPSLIGIRKCLKDKEFTVRYQAVLTIRRVAEPDSAIAKDLIPLLDDDEHPDVIGEVIGALGGFGSHARVAIPALTRIQSDIRFRDSAKFAISQIKESK